MGSSINIVESVLGMHYDELTLLKSNLEHATIWSRKDIYWKENNNNNNNVIEIKIKRNAIHTTCKKAVSKGVFSSGKAVEHKATQLHQ